MAGMDDIGGKTNTTPTGADSRAAHQGKDTRIPQGVPAKSAVTNVQQTSTRQHYSEYHDQVQKAGVRDVGAAAKSNATHAGILGSFNEVPSPLPKPQMVKSIASATGLSGTPK